MRVAGIDPGIANLGWAIVCGDNGIIDCGVITTKASLQKDLRLLYIYEQLEAVLDRNDMAECHMANERLPYNSKMMATSSIGEVVGVIGLLSAFYQMQRFEYSPAAAKKDATGSGKATKDDMIRNARDLGWKGPLKEHSADAIAIALMHLRTLRK